MYLINQSLKSYLILCFKWKICFNLQQFHHQFHQVRRIWSEESCLMPFFLSLFKGVILRFPIWGDPADDNCYDDEVYWEVRVLLYHKMVFLSFKSKGKCLSSCVGFRFPRMRRPSLLSWSTTTTWYTSTKTCKLAHTGTLPHSLLPLVTSH